MLGLMMDKPLLISSVLDHAAKYHGGTEIVSRTVEGPIHRYTYADAQPRAKKLAQWREKQQKAAETATKSKPAPKKKKD